MSASSSTISRSRVAIAACMLTAVISLYYLNTLLRHSGDSGGASSGLRRSNAVHRSRRRSQWTADPDNAPAQRATGGMTIEDFFDEEEPNASSPLPVRRNEQSPPIEAETVVDEDSHPAPSVPIPLIEQLPPLDLETVVDEDLDDWAHDDSPLTRRNGQNVVQLLFRVSEEATRQSSYVHRGCHCDACGTVPIRGIRYRCSNCADYDLCEACEAQQLHTKTHIFYKIRVPAYSFSSRQSQPPCYPGQPDTALSQLPKALITRLSKETGFERQEIYAYWEQFTFMANTEWRDDPDGLCLAMDRVTFDQCLVPSGGWRNLAPNLIFDRMFAFYDTNHDGLISFPEFLNGLAFRKKKDKLRKIFEGYDLDGDGYVDRKDFLRMFRSYYTMYKAIHEDLLESLHDHTISSTEAQQLISGRQPLSSLFSRDMPFSGGGTQEARAGEGKAPANGDLEVIDGRGAVNESGKDQGEREDVIIDGVVLEHARRQEHEIANRSPSSVAFHLAEEATFAPDSQVRDAYWEAMLDPPTTIDELQHNLLDTLIQSRQERLEAMQLRSMIPTAVALRMRDLGTSAEDNEIRHELLAGAFNISNWPPEYVEDEDVEAVCGDTMTMAEVPAHDMFDIVKHALRRRRQKSLERQIVAAKNAINERWKRRQFYTDEEEGVTQPDYYDIEEEISEDARVPSGIIHTAASSPRPMLSPRSRSSSKVRFAEATDDYDVRSNPSTSSRSVPERWGGMDIPEAEKDAGRDILYQVTQQAFNELLDPLFKVREDMAMNVMATKREREACRHLFTAPGFEKWANAVDQNATRTPEAVEGATPFQELEAGMREGNHEPYPKEDLDPTRRQSLKELLTATAYQIISPGSTPLKDRETSADDHPILLPDEDANAELDAHPTAPPLDPTLPQNRPSSIPAPPRARFHDPPVPDTAAPWSPHHPLTHSSKGKEKETQEAAEAPRLPTPSRARLYLLRCHEKYECKAKEMGGWGRLDFREWEAIVRGQQKGDRRRGGGGQDGGGGGAGREEAQGQQGGRFDYLGGWIDICIPMGSA